MMIKKKLFLAFTVGILGFSSVEAGSTTGIPVLVTIGNTNNPYVSYLVIDDTSLGNSAIEYAWYYSSMTETNGTPLDGLDLLTAVAAGTTNTTYAFTPIYDPTYGNAGLDGFQIGNQTSTVISLTNTVAPYVSWAYWGIKGSGFDGTYTNTSWNLLFDDYDQSRTLTNGSWDGWTISPYDPITFFQTGPAPLSTAAVPEPNTAPLLLLSLGTILALLRWKSSARNTTV